MNYQCVVIGTTDNTEQMCTMLLRDGAKIDLLVSIQTEVLAHNHISGYFDISRFAAQHGIDLFLAGSYKLNDPASVRFFEENTFELGICVGWQRLIPQEILDKFRCGVFGMHGSSGYLPFGKGRSPMNWSILEGGTRIVNNLFKYDDKADNGAIFSKVAFEITPHDTIRTLQFKAMLVGEQQILSLLEAHRRGDIPLCEQSRETATWYPKRSPADGKIDFSQRTEAIFNLIRATTAPFPGAFATCEGQVVRIWNARPFDAYIDFSRCKSGEVIDVLDGHPLIKTIDGSLILYEYESPTPLAKGMLLA